MSSYFYHCTVNTADILVSGQLRKGGSRFLGIKAVSFFWESKRPIPESDRYYNAPDDRNPLRFGESVFPVKSAFCFEPEKLKDQFPPNPRDRNGNELPGGYREKRGYDEDSGLLKKGSGEYLFPQDLSLTNPAFWGIRVPSGYPESEKYYVRAIATLFLLGRPDARVAFGCNDFYRAHNLFYKVKNELAGLLPFKFTPEALEDVNQRISRPWWRFW